MGKLIFIGLGLHDERGITLRGIEVAGECDMLFAEFYTSTLTGTSINRLESHLRKKIHVLTREEVERGERVLKAAEHSTVALLVPGDAMMATTHVALRLKAMAQGIVTDVIMAPSIFTGAPSLCGLSHYKFGMTTTIPFEEPNYRPDSPYDVLKMNRENGLHTLILLDIRPDRFMTPNEGMKYLLAIEKERAEKVFIMDTLVCVVSRVGAQDAKAQAGLVKELLAHEFGAPLHSLIAPGKLHFIEEEALRAIS